MADEELNFYKRPMSSSVSKLTERGGQQKELDVGLESDSEAENKRLLAQFKVRKSLQTRMQICLCDGK